MFVCLYVCYRSRKKTLDRNDLKLGTVVLLNSPPKPIDFVPNRQGSGGTKTKFLPADHKLAPQVGVAWGTCPISKFRDPLNISVSDEATLFKFGVHVDPGLFLPADQKLAPKWAWPGERAQFQNFGTPSISLGRIKPRFSNLVRTWSLGCSCTRTTNWPRSGRGLEYVPNFEFLGPAQHLWIG